MRFRRISKGRARRAWVYAVEKYGEVGSKLRPGCFVRRRRTQSILNARLQLHAAAFDGHAVFDFVPALLLELLRFFAHEFLKIAQARCSRAFPGFGPRLDQL